MLCQVHSSHFFLSERLRRTAFDRAPLGRDFVVNGHSTRVFTRTSLQIVRAIDRAVSDESFVVSRHIPGRRYFVVQARRHIDLLTRYFSRYPSERPSLLVLEASFTRSLGIRRPEPMVSALKILNEADSLMFATPDRPRVRWRLLLERSKVLMALMQAAKLHGGEFNGETTLGWLGLAVYDVIRLKRLIRGRSRLVWERNIKRHADQLHIYCRELGVTYQTIGIEEADWLDLTGK